MKNHKQSKHQTSPQPSTQVVVAPGQFKLFLTKSVPLYIILIISALLFGSAWIVKSQFTPQDTIETYGNKLSEMDNHVKVVRENDSSLIQPILYVEIESKQLLSPLKSKINDYLDSKKQAGAYTSASVYLKDVQAGVYININPDSLYDPASLMKVPLLMIYLKQAETNPQLLKKSFVFTQQAQNSTVALIKDKSLVVGKSYTVQELLYHMIVYSDNESFWILYDHFGEDIFKELDKKLTIPANYDIIHYSKTDKHFIANVNSMAYYFMVLYNASYLTKTASKYALDILTKSTFKEGLAKGIDPNVLIAHKFGERTLSYYVGNKLENLQTEFHEFGIVYLKNRPYLLGVMTRGQQSNVLQTIVSDISKMVYDDFKNQSNGNTNI
ncbi:MAG TPA: class A beta-lactamase-related serine hydrolase [Chitinophagaceae bacterium]|jgi:beta-lactamase class A|nr:class A beta-lactamase-related serine hydrolase [Chitinophagaceae bacterium]